jgi:hypothetical protein
LFARAGRLLVIFCVGVFGGCSFHDLPKDVAPPNITFDRQSRDALVVIGCVGSGGSVKSLLLGEIYPYFDLTWLRTEKDSDGYWVGFHTAMKRFTEAVGLIHLQHTVYAVPPGRYVLSPNSRDRQLDAAHDHDPQDAHGRGFRAQLRSRAGEITYIGDFAIDVLPAFHPVEVRVRG